MPHKMKGPNRGDRVKTNKKTAAKRKPKKKAVKKGGY